MIHYARTLTVSHPDDVLMLAQSMYISSNDFLNGIGEQQAFINCLSNKPGTLRETEVDELDRYFIENYGTSLSDVHCNCDPDSPNLYDYLLNHTKTYREGHPSYRKPFDIEDQLRDVREQASDELKAEIDERLNQ